MLKYNFSNRYFADSEGINFKQQHQDTETERRVILGARFIHLDCSDMSFEQLN